MARGTHPAFLLIEPEVQDIREAQVSELIPSLYFLPAEGRVRVSVLAPAERLNETSSNALLKVLEEPPRANLLILCCREPGSVLPTIASRCQAVFFEPLTIEAVQGWLERQGISEERARLAAYLSGGSLSRASRLIQPEAWESRQTLLSAIPGLSDLATLEVLGLAGALVGPARRGNDALERVRDRLRDLLGALASLLRDGLVLRQTGDGSRVVNVDFLPVVEGVAASGVGACLKGLQLIQDSERAISANCDPQLVTEALLLGLGREG
jgi:DNA polymerase-3 subunit delta'